MLGDLAPDSDARRAADAEQELQAFSYMVSHDLAASFRHVAEFSRLLIGELGDELTTRQLAHVAHIRTATDKCQTMIEQVLAFSRIQQKTLEPVRQDATPIAKLPLLQLATEVKASAAEITIEPLGEVKADMALLGLAFRHLLGNAIKFVRPGVSPCVTVQPAHDDEAWRVRISDNGIGVEPAYREKAFRMFQRLNGEDAYPGVGAGLAICRRIARRHGGEVAFLDCAEGACVELALPRWEPLS